MAVDANEKFATGDVVSVVVKSVSGDSVETIKVEVSAKETKTNVNKETYAACQGKYVGKVTDVYQGNLFLCLNCKVNAVAHSCNSKPPRARDEVGFW